MVETPEFLAGRLSDEGERVTQFFNGLAPKEWEVQIYASGACWTPRQILAHFAITEANICLLIKDILSGGSGVSEVFDLDAFNERNVAAWESLPPEELLARFADKRRKTVVMVQQMSPADLQKIGRHPFLGVVPLVDIIRLMYRHNQIHLREIRHVLSQKV